MRSDAISSPISSSNLAMVDIASRSGLTVSAQLAMSACSSSISLVDRFDSISFDSRCADPVDVCEGRPESEVLDIGAFIESFPDVNQVFVLDGILGKVKEADLNIALVASFHRLLLTPGKDAPWQLGHRSEFLLLADRFKRDLS